MSERAPLIVRLEGGFMMFLTAWGLLAIVVLLQEGWAQLPAQLLVRWILLTLVTGTGAWFLMKGVAWGYVLGFVAGIYWLFVAVRLFSLITPDSDISVAVGAILYSAVGATLLAGLLMPSARKWFMATWRTEGREPTAAG